MNISNSMLFRWVGYDIERPGSWRLPAPKRKDLDIKPDLNAREFEIYLTYLKDALNPDKGLKAGGYSPNDAVGTVTPISLPEACLYFSEQAAGTSESHWLRYGRLGFGFSKWFIYRCGGRPVIYTQGISGDPIAKAVDSLRRMKGKIRGRVHQDAMGQHLELLARHIKCTSLPRREKREAGKRERKVQSPYQLCDFPRHNEIMFLGEREWRLLVDRTKNRLWREAKEKGKSVWWFRPEVGRELQVIVVPNNFFLKAAMECEGIRSRLVGKTGRPIQLISAQALQKV